MADARLEAAARAAGLIDHDLLALADATLPPVAAIRELQARHPAAFRIPRAETLSRADYPAAKAEMLRQARRAERA